MCFFWFILDYFVLVLFAFVMLGLVSSVLRQEIGWEERLQNDLFLYSTVNIDTCTISVPSVDVYLFLCNKFNFEQNMWVSLK